MSDEELVTGEPAATAREQVTDVVNTLFLATDARDWPRVEACFASRVTLDMTSVAGGTPAELTPQQITAGWHSGLLPIDAVHHQTGNHTVRVHGREATVFCYGIAYHYRRTRSGRNTRVFVGSYEFHLVDQGGWRIDLFRFNLKFVDGNLDLEREPSV